MPFRERHLALALLALAACDGQPVPPPAPAAIPDPLGAVRSQAPHDALVCPPATCAAEADRPAPAYPATADDLLAAWTAALRDAPRTTIVATDPTRQLILAQQRSAVFGFLDTVTVRVLPTESGATFAAYSVERARLVGLRRQPLAARSLAAGSGAASQRCKGALTRLRIIFLVLRPSFRYPVPHAPDARHRPLRHPQGPEPPLRPGHGPRPPHGPEALHGPHAQAGGTAGGHGVPADVETLVAEPEFKALIDGYNTLHAMPEEEQRRILTQLARHLLMEATALGDVRVAMFILLQERMGKDPARTLADGVIAANKRAAAAGTSPAHAQPLAASRIARPTTPSCGRCSGWRAACAASCSRSMRRFTPLWRRTKLLQLRNQLPTRSRPGDSAARLGRPRPRSSATTRAAPSRSCCC